MTPVWPHGDPRDVARSILSDRRFGGQTSDKEPEKTLWDRVLQWIGDRLSEIFHGIARALGSDNPWNVTIAVLISLAIALVLGYLVYKLVSRYAYTRSNAARRVAFANQRLAHERTAADLRRDAFAAARAGRYREAAALMFGSAVRALDEAGRVPYDAARTPGEYRRLVRNSDFDTLANGAVVAIFAPAEPQADAFDRMTQAYDAFFRGGAA